jgi:hypothetical protein
MADEKKKPEYQKKKLNIELPESVSEGTYVNLAVITHSSSEFVIDFIRVMPGLPKAKVKTRTILTPPHAKRLLRALEDNIKRYESNHGEIKEDRNMDSIPMNFGGPTPEA